MSDLISKLEIAAREYEDEAGRDGRYALADNTLYMRAAKRIAELEAHELGWLTTLSSMELEVRTLRAQNQRLRCSHNWQVVDAHSEDCRVCGESRLSPCTAS